MSRLLVTHNLSESKLETALILGGFPAPSLAIIKDDTGFNDYGEITLVMGSAFDIEKFPTFRSDVYSQRAPRAMFEVRKDGLNAISSVIEGILKDNRVEGLSAPFNGSDSQVLNKGLEYYSHEMSRSSATMLAYALKNGYGVQIEREKPYTPYKFLETPSEYMDTIVNGNLHSAREGTEDFDRFNECAYAMFAQYFNNSKHRSLLKKSVHEEAEKYFSLSSGKPVLYISVLDGVVNYIKEAYINKEQPIDSYALKESLKPLISEGEVANWVKAMAVEFDVFHSPFFVDFDVDDEPVSIPYNLDNLVTYISKGVRGAENFFYGAGTIRSMITSQIRTLEEVEALSDSIVSELDFVEVGGAINEKLNIFSELVSENVKGGDGLHSPANNLILDYAKDGDRTAFRKFVDGFLPDEFFNELDKFFVELNESPTAYFESKPLQPIYLTDFEMAIVPDDISEGAKSALIDAGLTIKEYPANDRESRLKLLKERDTPSIAMPGSVNQERDRALEYKYSESPSMRMK